MKRSILFHTLCVLVGFLFTSVITVFGSNVTNEFEKVLALAEQGDAAAQYNLGEMYRYGRGVAKDFAEAVKWYRKSAEQGNADAQNNLGGMYYNGQGVAQDYSEAVKWCRKSAEQGNADAQNNLGGMYYNGQGVMQDYVEAVKWYRKAAEQGYAPASWNLGVMYAKGQGVAKDYSEAVKWYRKSAEQGSARSQYKLGKMYKLGQGVTIDYSEALKWYRKAAEQGDARAQCDLGVMYKYGQGVTKDYSEAVKWYRKSAEQGYARAQFILGEMYENGQGVTQDYAEAMKWYTKAAEQGNRSAKSSLFVLKNRFNITTEIIEGYWTNVLENATLISVDPRSKNADSKKGEGMLEAFGMQYMPNAYEYYQEVRAKAIEREQMFKENFPEGKESDSTGGELYTEIMKAMAKAVGEYFRRRDELCHFYLMHKAGIMNSQELMKLDEAKISMVLPAIDIRPFVLLLETEVSKLTASERILVEKFGPSPGSKLTATERTFAEKYMPSTLVAYDRNSKQMTETLELRQALALDYSILDALRGELALNVVNSRFCRILDNNNFLVAIFKENLLRHSVEEITAEKLAKEDEELSVAVQGFEKELPIHDYGKEWLSKNWTDKEKFNVILGEAPVIALRLLMVEIPGKDYMMCKYEVTQGLWKSIMGESQSDSKGDLTKPVESVSWDDVQVFLKKLNALPEVKASGLEYRLPTADEWEYACRAGATGDYCKLADGTEITEATLGDVAWLGHGRTRPVGIKKPNAYGLYDMHGNVMEWTSTDHDVFYICCGGSWYNSGDKCRSSSRDMHRSFSQNSDVGFRLCASRRADKAQEGK